MLTSRAPCAQVVASNSQNENWLNNHYFYSMTRDEKIQAIVSKYPKSFENASDEIKILTVDGNELYWTLKHPDKVTPQAFEELKNAFMPLKHQSEK